MPNKLQSFLANVAKRVLGDAVSFEADQSSSQKGIQRQFTGLGAEFGQRVTKRDLLFAATREPVAHLLTFTVANDIFDKWFSLKPAGDSRINAEKFNENAMDVLAELKAKDVFTQATVYERIYGWSIIVVGFKDRGESNRDPVKNPSEILDLEAYGPPAIVSVDVDKNEESDRYGEPVLYKVQRSGTRQELVHFSRVIHFVTRKAEPGYEGLSVLEAVWDDLTSLRNIRWGLAQTLYRYGSGFPVITVQGASPDQLREYQREWGPLTAKTSLWTDEKQTVEFLGLQGRALDPEHYYLPIMENISAGSNIPLPMIRGAQAGQLSGSEVNEREYFKFISDCQGRLEPSVRRLIDKLMETGQIRPKTEYVIEWKGAFELNPVDRARAEFYRSQALKYQTSWKTVNEIRMQEGLEEHPDGDVILGLQQQGGFMSTSQENREQYTKRMLEIQAKFGKPVPKLLAERIERGDSVAKICRDLGIATDTYYNWASQFGLWP